MGRVGKLERRAKEGHSPQVAVAEDRGSSGREPGLPGVIGKGASPAVKITHCSIKTRESFWLHQRTAKDHDARISIRPPCCSSLRRMQPAVFAIEQGRLSLLIGGTSLFWCDLHPGGKRNPEVGTLVSGQPLR